MRITERRIKAMGFEPMGTEYFRREYMIDDSYKGKLTFHRERNGSLRFYGGASCVGPEINTIDELVAAIIRHSSELANRAYVKNLHKFLRIPAQRY